MFLSFPILYLSRKRIEMEKFIEYQGRKVYYSIEGHGEVLLFIHGYLESSAIWSGFSDRFNSTYTTLCIDIPGHGHSEVLGPIHEMEEMARVISVVLEAEGIEKVVVFGHSMGGYISMELLHIFPEKIRGYCLFHSTCFSDNEEKKLNRDREISLVMCGKKMQIIHTNIPKGFADRNIVALQAEIKRVKEIAAASSDDGTIALLQGMKTRKDHSDLLRRRSPVPLIVWGSLDNFISEEVYEKMLALAPHATVIKLRNSGHMGFIEEAECAYAGIMNYLDTLK